MRLGYSTWGMQTLPAEESIPLLAGIGYDSIEIAVVPGWRDELDSLTPARRRRVAELLAEHRLGLAAIASHRSLVSTDPAAHADNWRRLLGAVDLAVEWGGADPLVDLTVGGKPAEWDDVRSRLVERLGRLCDHAAERGVTIAIKPHVANALDTPDRVLWLLAELKRPHLGVTLDISHFDVQGIPMEESVARLAPVSRMAHVKDERGSAPEHEFLIPGEGQLDFVYYLRALYQAGYDRDVCVEIPLMVQRRSGFDPARTAEQSYRVLAEAFVRAGIARER